MLFVLAGAIFLTPLIVAGFVPPDRHTPRQKGAIKLVQQILGCLLLTSFAAVPLWIGFGPGERAFSSSISSSGLTSSGRQCNDRASGIRGDGNLDWNMGMFTWIGLLRAVMIAFRRSGEDGAM
jgi:hypothetical protein